MATVTNKHKAWLLVLTTFFFGVLVGASGQYFYMKPQIPMQAKTVGEISDELGVTLHLEPSQKGEIYKILEESYRQHGELKNEYRPKHETIRLATRARINDLLNADQKVAFEKWTRAIDEKREKAAAEEKKKQ
jgi:hypothetical protein